LQGPAASVRVSQQRCDLKGHATRFGASHYTGNFGIARGLNSGQASRQEHAGTSLLAASCKCRRALRFPYKGLQDSILGPLAVADEQGVAARGDRSDGSIAN
jgi:hypothetical protein